MKRLSGTFVGVAIFVAAAVTASSALAATPKPVLISGKYAGTASTKVEGDVVTISAAGTGSATMLGKGKITGAGTGDSSQQPCIPFGGTGTITGIVGTKITYKLLPGASSCGDEGGHVFSVKTKLTVVKATGKLLKAKGTLTITGVYDRDAGTFSIKLFGTLKK